MSSVATWGREDILTVDAAPSPVPLAEAALDYRLKSLKEVARALLQEIEALSTAQPQDPSQNVRLHDEVQRFESSLICHALGRTGGSQTRAAKLLGVKLTTLNTKIKRYKIAHYGKEPSSENNFQNHENAA